jgi:hypothetical protein
MKKAISVTGHRKLEHSEDEITNDFVEFLERLNEPIVVNTGMALGFDLLVAEICLIKGIEYNAILPFDNHLKGNEKFEILKEGASKVIIVSPGPYEKWKYFKRDQWLVNNCSELYAYLVTEGRSGTRLTVDFAIKNSKPVTYFNLERNHHEKNS